MRIHPDLLANFSRTTVLVIGDLMLDESLWGHIQRISPEAPVPILSLERREARAEERVVDAQPPVPAPRAVDLGTPMHARKIAISAND